MHYNIGFEKMSSPLFSAALQNRLAAGFCHCIYTFEGLLCIQVGSDPPPMHCNTVKEKRRFPLLSVALQTGWQQATGVQ